MSDGKNQNIDYIGKLGKISGKVGERERERERERQRDGERFVKN